MKKLLFTILLFGGLALSLGTAEAASRFWVGGTGTWDGVATSTWSATSGGAGGASVPGASDTVTLDASSGGGTVTVGTGYNPSVISITMGAFTGTLDFSAFNNSPTMQTFSASGTGTRTLNMGSGTWTITGNGTTIWTTATSTNLTLNSNTSTLNFTYAGATGNRLSNFTGTVMYDVNITAGSDASFDTNAFAGRNLSFAGFTGSHNANVMNISGNLTMGTGMTQLSGVNAWTFSSTSSGKTITTNGVQMNVPITFNGVGGTWTLQDNLDMGGANERIFTITNGIVDSNNKVITCARMSIGAGGTFLGGNQIHIINGTAGNFAINASATISGTYTLKFTDTSNTATTLSGAGKTFYNVWFSRGASTASNTLTGSNTFNDFRDTGTVAHSILFTANTTTTVSNFRVSGTSGNLITIGSATAATSTLSAPKGRIYCNYCSISRSKATGGATWYAGTNSTDGGNNTGWIFTAVPISSGSSFQIRSGKLFMY